MAEMQRIHKPGTSKKTRARAPTAVELPQKLLYLSNLAKIGLDVVFAETHAHKKTAEKLLKPDQIINRPVITGIIKYFDRKLGLGLNALICDFFKSSFEDFCSEIQQRLAEKRDMIAVKLESDSEKMAEAEIRYICGKYELYRYSFSGYELIARELLTIQQVNNNSSQLEVKMYTQIAHQLKEIPVETLMEDKEEPKKPDIFHGTIFKFGKMYYIAASYSDKNKDHRMRFLFFPALDSIRGHIHYGILTGYSDNLSEPVASRAIAVKVSPRSTLNDGDMSKVKTDTPDDEAFAKYRELIEFDPRLKIENAFKERNPTVKDWKQWLMTVDKTRIRS